MRDKYMYLRCGSFSMTVSEHRCLELATFVRRPEAGFDDTPRTNANTR